MTKVSTIKHGMIKQLQSLLPLMLAFSCNGMDLNVKKARVESEERVAHERPIFAEVRIILCDEEAAKIPAFGSFVCPGFPLEMRYLTILSLEGNHLKELPRGFGALTALKKLSLAHNELTGLFPPDCSFRLLEELDISDTRVGAEAGYEIVKTETIETIHGPRPVIRAETVEGAQPVIWSGLSSLKKLIARRACFSVLDDTIANLHSLTSIDFSHNNLRTINPMLYLRFTLISCDFSDNKIGHLSAEVSNFVNLEEFRMDGNLLQEVPSHIGQLARLRVLSLSGNRLKALPEECAQLLKLRFLNLSQNRLVERPPFLSKLTELEEVYLD